MTCILLVKFPQTSFKYKQTNKSFKVSKRFLKHVVSVAVGVQQHQPAQLARYPDRAAGDHDGAGADSHLCSAADAA